MVDRKKVWDSTNFKCVQTICTNVQQVTTTYTFCFLITLSVSIRTENPPNATLVKPPSLITEDFRI